MTETSKTPITVLGGWLGAGKTTMVNRLLRATNERLAIIVNDVGDVNVDAEFLREDSDDTDGVIELTNGCVCCAIGDDLYATVHELTARTPAPHRIVLEASGVADLFPITTFLNHPRASIDAVIALADPDNFEYLSSGPPYGSLMRSQLSGADLVVATKLDLIPDDERDAALDGLRKFTKAQVIPASDDPTWLNTVMLGSHENTDRPDDHEATAPVATTTWRPTSPVVPAAITQALTGSRLLRAKGSVATADGAVRVHLVGGRVELTTLDDDTAPLNAIVLIGHSADQLDEVATALSAATG